MIRFPRKVSAGVVAVLALAGMGQGFAQESRKSTLKAEQIRMLELEGMSGWLREKFSSIELDELRSEDLALESHFCGCADAPRKHFPYVVVVLRTPKGDLIARPEGHEAMVQFAPLAVRNDDVYCDPKSDANCYGTFAHPCDFTDFRYGHQLAEFFPTCKND
ncbi:MAG: hypothetical protein ACKVP2_07000 [Burkholderiales bacterium]